MLCEINLSLLHFQWVSPTLQAQVSATVKTLHWHTFILLSTLSSKHKTEKDMSILDCMQHFSLSKHRWF